MFDVNAVKLDPKININFGKSKKSIGILNKGKNNKIINNEISGFSVGIQDEGQDTTAQGNKIK